MAKLKASIIHTALLSKYLMMKLYNRSSPEVAFTKNIDFTPLLTRTHGAKYCCFIHTRRVRVNESHLEPGFRNSFCSGTSISSALTDLVTFTTEVGNSLNRHAATLRTFGILNTRHSET